MMLGAQVTIILIVTITNSSITSWSSHVRSQSGPIYWGLEPVWCMVLKISNIIFLFIMKYFLVCAIAIYILTDKYQLPLTVFLCPMIHKTIITCVQALYPQWEIIIRYHPHYPTFHYIYVYKLSTNPDNPNYLWLNFTSHYTSTIQPNTVTDFHLIYCHEVVIMMQPALYQTYHQEHRNRKITQQNSLNTKPSLDLLLQISRHRSRSCRYDN